MTSTAERFWIAFILRFAFGFLFLFAALNIFNYGPEKFAKDLAAPMAGTWLGDVEAKLISVANKDIEYQDATRDQAISWFLGAMPYILGALSVCILSGILLRPALRMGAVLMVILGLGKYVQNDIATAAFDFSFAFMICVGLYFLSLKKKADGEERLDSESGGFQGGTEDALTV